MKLEQFFIIILLMLNFICFSQTLNIHSISHNRQPNGGQYTLDGTTMNTGGRLKLLSTANFGVSGTYSKSISITDGFLTSNSLTQTINLPYNDIFFFGSFIKSDITLVQFTNEEIDSLYNWSERGGKLIICAGASEGGGGVNLAILNSKWDFQITQATSASFIPNSIGLNTDIFSSPFGTVSSATQGGSIQGYFSSLPSNTSVLATDINNNPTLIMDCNTLDLILADIDGYTSSPGTVTTGSDVINDQDKFWVNTIVFMDKLQGLPTIGVNGTTLSVANIYNSYQWYKDDVAINSSTSNSIVVNEDGQYYVKVTVNGGCEVKSNTIMADSTLGINENTIQSVVLEQNVPNPFAEQTTINYTLPENTVKAQILFYNSQGKLIQSTELTQKGSGQLNVFASDLSNGIYTYTLVVDGRIVDSKKMIRNK